MKKAIQGLGILVTATILQSVCAQSTNGPVINIFKVVSGQAAVLQWYGATNEIYRIDYSAELTNWITAADDIPNQGTNTVWGDFGSESGIAGRASSADPSVPTRFYRVVVQGYSSNIFPALITVSNASDGTILSGLTNIRAGIVTTSNVISGKLMVDGNEAAIGSGSSYEFDLETRHYPNGAHRLSIVVENDGDAATTGGDDPVPDPASEAGASYATKNVTVVFTNLLSDAWLKYRAFRPELSQTQEVRATWSTGRNWRINIASADNTNVIYRTFTGSGTKVLVSWDGRNSGGQLLNPQRIAYVILDLGAALLESAVQSKDVELAAEDGGGAPQPNAADGSPLTLYSTYKTFGTFGMLYQGHHPRVGGYPRPPRGAPFGQVTFSSSTPFPWGRIRASRRIANYLVQAFPIAGYPLGFIYADDNFKAQALQKTSLGGSNIFNNVTVGLYVGHSAAGKENIVALAHPQSYIPVYSHASDSFTWIGMNDMNLGSSNLKWVAFYSCNLFRDDPYRLNPVYTLMKNNEHLAMNSDLHIMQAFATENTVHSGMGQYWVVALIGGTKDSGNHTVLGAWRFVCLQTQPVESSGQANVSRSAYWPECSGDYIYGYGSQTDPDPDHLQAELLEDDQRANTAP